MRVVLFIFIIFFDALATIRAIVEQHLQVLRRELPPFERPSLDELKSDGGSFLPRPLSGTDNLTVPQVTQMGGRVGAEITVALDFWAIRDLVMLGYYGLMMRGPHNSNDSQPSQALLDTQAGAMELASMLHEIHPVVCCREAIKEAETLVQKAEASWSCLGLNNSSFDVVFNLSMDKNASKVARNPKPLFIDELGACRTSLWPRACSYWTSMHAMSIRADVLGKSMAFLRAITRIMAGGALFCGGCQRHFILLMQPLVPASINDKRNHVDS
jgi:hypothetical protein